MADQPGRTVVYLLRHGQTALNETGLLRGLLDPPLDDTGQRQARSLGAVFGPRRPALIVASPLRRAMQTAQPAADAAGLTVVADRHLVDRDYGPWTGKPKQAVTERWGSVDDAPGVEPLPEVRHRAVVGLAGIARRWPGRAVVAVSHDAVNAEVLLAFGAGFSGHDAVPQDNGCFNTLEYTPAGWAVTAVNIRPAEG
jgi:glucosyl-3-phosphoglycerate phosphatase